MITVFEGRVFSVEVGEVDFPDGPSHRVEIVRHHPSVVLIPIQDDGRVILVRQFRAPLGREIWELPAGSLNANEDADRAAARECEEEIGLVPTRIERIRSLYPAPGFCDEELIFFRVSRFVAPPPDSPHKPDEDEHITAQPHTIAEARDLVARGVIVDLKTAYGLTLL